MGATPTLPVHLPHQPPPLRHPPPIMQDADPLRALACPRTKIGDRLGRFIVNRLKVSEEEAGGEGLRLCGTAIGVEGALHSGGMAVEVL